MFVPPPSELAKDHFELQISFGGWTYEQFFDRCASDYRPLPGKPPTAGTRCRCPGCVSEGWYASSPACRFWRAHCVVCSGSRRYYDRSVRSRFACDACEQAWTEDVRFFRDALRTPGAVVRRLRSAAARNAAAHAAPAATRTHRSTSRTAAGELTGRTH